MVRMKTLLAAMALTGMIPATALAQNEPLSQILPNLLLQSVIMRAPVGVPGFPHEAHFIAALGQNKTPFEINRLLVAQLGTFPIGSSSSGFVFNFDPDTGLFVPASQTFGSEFAERALTNGKGRFGFGVNYQRLQFKSFEGADLRDGSLAFILQHNDCCPPAPGGQDPFFEGDLVRMSLSLDVKEDIVAPFINYGINNYWDVAVVVPIVRVGLRPTIASSVDRISTCPSPIQCNPLIHSWDGLGASTNTPQTRTGNASGIGDLVLRTKYRFIDDGASNGVAGGLDVRLPTGDSENLLGTGVVQIRLLGIASAEFGRVSPHVNLGYTFSHGELPASLITLPSSGLPSNAFNPPTQTQVNAETGTPLADPHLPNEVNFVGGVDVAAHPLLTISADFIGRTILNTPRFATTAKTFNYRTANGAPLLSTDRDTFDITNTGTLNLLLGVVGAKFNIPGTPLLLKGNVLFPLTKAGLRPKVTPVVGIDYSFTR